MDRKVFAVILSGLLLSASPSAFAESKDSSSENNRAEIGRVDFQASCAPEVRDDFDHALGLMHHMMYKQARVKFKDITEADPGCAMAYWGIATTLFQPLWPERPDSETLQKGWEIIQKAHDKAPAEGRARQLIDATAAFFRGPGTAGYWERIRGWAEGMSRAYAANPDDHDVAALYALSRLALAMQADGRDPLHDEAETILRTIWEKEPTHPGAIHYSIHATDVDGRAENALDIVETYGKIAPEVPHALHMPSHIYVRLGDWPAVIKWNKRSAAAVPREPVNGLSLHYLHAMDYLVYAYLQQGRDDKAEAAVNTAMEQGKHQSSFVSAFHTAAMPARLAVEQRDWERAAALEPRTPEYLPWDNAKWAEGLVWYAKGLGGAHTDGLALAQQAEQRLKTLRDEADASGESGFATNIEIDRRILSGWIAYAQGKADQAVAQIHSAAELESTIQKSPVTPGALCPPNEALGDLLMKLDRPEQALKAYQASDEIWPGRFNTLKGAARAAKAAGNKKAARQYYQVLLDNAGDSKRPQVKEARAFLES
ncbi:hypothetical protein [Marinobacter sp.]|uniref:hypothetical protein n=1 Tax=Marinobacter sp. TaxID=50741 RepID=UPI00384D4AEF